MFYAGKKKWGKYIYHNDLGRKIVNLEKAILSETIFSSSIHNRNMVIIKVNGSKGDNFMRYPDLNEGFIWSIYWHNTSGKNYEC